MSRFILTPRPPLHFVERGRKANRLPYSLWVGVLLIFAFPTAAQDAAPTPPPVLDPAEIFSPHVEVVERLPTLTYDNEARMLWYFDPAVGEWAGYAYPETFTTIFTWWQFEEMYFFVDGSTPPYTSDNILIFDLENGGLLPSETICGSLVRYIYEPNVWQLYQSAVDGQYRLCNTATGEESDPLPSAAQSNIASTCPSPYISVGNFNTPVLSPDGQYVLFLECPVVASASLYSYNRATGQFYRLGAVGGSGRVRPPEWIDARRAVIVSYDSGSAQSNYYITTVDVAESLAAVELPARAKLDGTYSSSPAKLVWSESPPNADDDDRVFIYEHDFATGITEPIYWSECLITELELNLCAHDVHILASHSRYLVIVVDTRYTTQGLLLYDRQTGGIIHEGLVSIFEQFYAMRWLDENTLVYVEAVSDLQLTTLLTVDENQAVHENTIPGVTFQDLDLNYRYQVIDNNGWKIYDLELPCIFEIVADDDYGLYVTRHEAYFDVDLFNDSQTAGAFRIRMRDYEQC